MASLAASLAAPSAYKDAKFLGTYSEFVDALLASSTLYVGNLSFFTTEEQIHELFGKAGEIKRIIMGLDRNKKTPCGFCFVEYYSRSAAVDCILFINGSKVDERIIRTDMDPGFIEGRQFGRGKRGGQVRDEFRDEFDAGRGGWGHQKQDLYLDADFDVAPAFAGEYQAGSQAVYNGGQDTNRRRRQSVQGYRGSDTQADSRPDNKRRARVHTHTLSPLYLIILTPCFT